MKKHKITKKKNRKIRSAKKASTKRRHPKALNLDLEGGVKRSGAFSEATARIAKEKRINENIINNCKDAAINPVTDTKPVKKAREILGLPEGFMKEEPEKRSKMLEKAKSYKLSICKDANLKSAMKDVNIKKYSENIEAAFKIVKDRISEDKSLNAPPLPSTPPPEEENQENQEENDIVPPDENQEEEKEEEDIEPQFPPPSIPEEKEEEDEEYIVPPQQDDNRLIEIQTNCDAENENYVGLGIDTELYNNCYLNAVLQMLYHMCYFRKGLINEPNKPNISKNTLQEKAAYSLKEILKIYYNALQENKVVIKLHSVVLKYIKNVSNIDPNKDEQEDPSQVIYNLLPIVDETNNNLSNNTIFGANNAQLFEDTAPFPYIYSLSLANKNVTSLQQLINQNRNTLEQINHALASKENTQRYIIFQIARYNIVNRATPKRKDFIKPDTIIQFTYKKDNIDLTTMFRLKGVIVHIGATISNGHYIYITYAKDGTISGIYNNGQFTKINVKNGQIKYGIKSDNPGQPTQGDLLDIPTILKDPRTLVNQNGYLFLYEIINDLPDAPTHPVLPDAPTHPVLPDAATGPLQQDLKQPQPKNQDPSQLQISNLNPNLNYKPQTVTQPVDPLVQITEATRIAKRLFGIPDDKTVDNKDLVRRKKQLEYKINKYNKGPDQLTDLMKIIKNATTFLVLIPKSLTRFEPTYKDKLKSFFNEMSNSDKTALITFSEKFVPQYKALTFKQSTIELRPKRDPLLDETKTLKMCNSVSKLSRQIYTRKIIPSQLPNLLEKKDVIETKKIFISDKKEKENKK